IVLDAELQQPLAIDFDRIALEPRLEFALGPVGPWIRARMAAVAIGETLDERRPSTRARLLIGSRGGAVDHVGVVAVDDDRLEAVGRGAIGGRMLDWNHVADRRVFHVEIILTYEYHRQLPDRRKVHRLVEGADVRGAVTEEAHRDVVRALVLGAPRGPAGDRQMRADDR